MSSEKHQKARETEQRDEQEADFRRAEEHAPPAPQDLPKRDWKATLKRAVAEFGDDGGTDLAAALTYYAVMSIAPLLLAISSLLGVFGQKNATITTIEQLGAELGLKTDTLASITEYVKVMQESDAGGIMLVVGILGALWSASNYINAFSRMMNKVYEIEEGRPVWILRPWLLLITLLVILMLMAIVLSVSVSGDVSKAIFGVFGLSETANTIWNIAKWPVILLVLVGLVALLYWGTPNIKQPSFRWLSPGAVVAILVALVAALGFGFYALNFGSYNKTYGALGGVIIALLMIWLINTALVLGAEVDAELERGRELAAGLPAEETIQLPPRSSKAADKKAEKAAEHVREARELRMQAARKLREAGQRVGLEGRGRD